MVLVGAFQVNKLVTILAATGIVLGAVYMLWLYKRVMFGKVEHKDVEVLSDINMREIAMFAPLVFLVVLMGIYPALFTDMLHASVENLVQHVQASTSDIAVSQLLYPFTNN